MGWNHQLDNLGGGFYVFFFFHPENWGRWTHFDEHIFQRGGVETTNENNWLDSLPKTNSLPLKPGRIPKGKDRFLTFYFQVLCSTSNGSNFKLWWSEMAEYDEAWNP